jgi:hypothetical protein
MLKKKFMNKFFSFHLTVYVSSIKDFKSISRQWAGNVSNVEIVLKVTKNIKMWIKICHCFSKQIKILKKLNLNVFFFLSRE